MGKELRKCSECPFCSGLLEEDKDEYRHYVFVFCRACNVVVGGYYKKRRSDYDSNKDKSGR